MFTVIYINLDRAIERREYMEDHFRTQGFPRPIRLSATDARSFKTLEDFTRYRPGVGGRWALQLSEAACFESHRRAWQAIVDMDVPAAVICEDDLMISKIAVGHIVKLTKFADDFDIIKLDFSPKRIRLGPLRSVGGAQLRQLIDTASSAGCYLISQSGCRKLLLWSESYSDSADDFIYRSRPYWRKFQVIPALAVQYVLHSEEIRRSMPAEVAGSERMSDVNVDRSVQKGPVGYRLAREIRSFLRRVYYFVYGDRVNSLLGGERVVVKLAGDIDFSRRAR